jgi:hypothetical protein
MSMSMNQPPHEEIARRAYDLYVSRGQAHGNDLGDWLDAELQVITASPPRTTVSRTPRRRPSKSKNAR